MTSSDFISFPGNFIWGAATSAYQIEGAAAEDGRGPSIWDTFSHTPGKTYQGHHGDVAADHYHRWQDDVRLMQEIGLQAYRFSISWSRVLPQGKGQVNPAGLDFYDRLIDALLAAGIEPIPTLYHYDLPVPLHDAGGWTVRDTAHHFGEYAGVLADRLGDRVRTWITHNEPAVVAMNGYLWGDHAPGIMDPFAAAKAAHYLLLSHGFALEALRAGSRSGAKIGIALNLSPVYPASQSEEDQEAANRIDAFMNKMFLHPLLCGEYPQELLALAGMFFPEIQPGDLEVISRPLDFVAVNYYTRAVIKHEPAVPLVEAAWVNPEGNDYSQMWEIYPAGIYDLLVRVWQEYNPKEILITENGVCVPDGLDFDGRVRDVRRIAYLRDHLVQVNRAVEAGAPVSGYLVWSLLDNFEWAYGYKMRFGLVYVDFETGQRTLKESGRWYSQVIARNGLDR